MFSESPSTPGRSAHVDRAMTSIFAPACDAAQSSSTMSGSTRWFTLSLMRARSPSVAAAATARISRTRPLRRVNGATSSFRNSLWPAEAGQVVEEVGDVRGDVVVGGEESDVLVLAGRRRVVVPRADVHVATQDAALATHDERRLRMNLHVGEAVGDVHPPARASGTTRCCAVRRNAP